MTLKVQLPAALVLFYCSVVAASTPRILLLYDMEGVTAVTTHGAVVMGTDGYDEARRSLADDVNAAIEGLLRGGAHEVVLTDGHGSGNPEPDYPLERLPPGARHEIRDRAYDPYLAVLEGDYSAVVAIGMHGGSGGSGFLAHTMLPHTRWIANGIEMNETLIVAALAAQSGAPLVLVTGDDVLETELRDRLPETRFVTVKTTQSPSSARMRPRPDVSRDIEQAAFEAVQGLDEVPLWQVLASGPIVSEFGYRTTAQAELASLFPQAAAVNDKAVRLRSESLLGGYQAFRALAQYTFLAHMRLVVETIYELEDGEEILARIGARMPTSDGRGFEPSSNHVDSSILATHGSK